MPEKNVFDILVERGYFAQVTSEEEVRQLLGKPGATFYIGFDPTADSLHVGHLIQIMAMAHMQRAGHRPIALLGGGTGMIGDPSGRSDLRQVLTLDMINANVARFREQMKQFLDFGAGKALMINNADWLLPLNYIEFLREIGSQFSVNRMLTAECYRQRLEKGLTFLEFNYMLLQAYDFLMLYRLHHCQLQLGGDDQWSNILAGAELIRRKDQGEAYGMTFRLLTTSAGTKMGKTTSGTVWLDPVKTTPFEFYQYWRNVDDSDVINCLKLLTFLSMEEIRGLAALQGEAINDAKTRLAHEVTRIVHGQQEADIARRQAADLFGGIGRSDQMPVTLIERRRLAAGGADFLEILLETGLVPSKGEGRRLIQQGGIYLNNIQVDDITQKLMESDFPGGEAILRKGKKIHHRLHLK
jgi:tyrosyl-tRNA synthetase